MDILITNVDASTLLPSFFELVLQQSLDECLTPALAHILPRSDRAGILKGALDSLSLIGFGSLASERLCGFSRASEGAAPLKRGRRAALSVALWVLLPPLWSALEASLKRRGDRVTRSGRPRLGAGIQALASLARPTTKVVNLAFQLAYLVGATKYFSANGWISRQVLVRTSVAKADKASSADPARRIAYFRYAVVSLVIIYKALEFLYREREEIGLERSDRNGRPAPPAPLPAIPAASGCGVPVDERTCPLCNRKRTLSATCGSGFVFCYRCLLDFVREHHCCPVTRQPASEESIIRIYDGGDD